MALLQGTRNRRAWINPEIVTKTLKAAGEQTLLYSARQLYLPGQEGCVAEQSSSSCQSCECSPGVPVGGSLRGFVL